MRLHLVSPGRDRADGSRRGKGVFPPLSLMTVAGLTPPSFEVSICDEAVDAVDFDADADIVGLTVMTASAPRAYEIADAFRARGVTVVMGGMHVSALPQEALQHADAVVIGEAELVWSQLLEDFAGGRLRQTYHSEEFPALENLPLARRDLVDASRYLGPHTLQASRGCPHGCSFCTVSTFFGRRYRMRPIEDVIEEAAQLTRKPLMFVDDNIVAQPSYSEKLFERLGEMKRTFFGQASTSILKTPELIKKAAEAGCKGLFVGLETLSTENLANIGKRVNVAEKYHELISRLHDHGIAIVGSFILGLDGDDADVFKRTADFAERAKIDVPQFSILTPLPGTRLYAQLEGEGRITERDWGKYDFQHVCFQPRQFNSDVLQAGMDWVHKRLYSWRSIIHRTGSRLQPLVWQLNAIYRRRTT